MFFAKAQRRKENRFFLILRLCVFAGVCIFALASLTATTQPISPLYGPAKVVARIKNSSVSESSGVTASRTMPGAYWTHNDSGDGPFIYAFDGRGESLGVFSVTGAQARDWEDMAAGPGPQLEKFYLYMGDIGDNQGSRSEVVVYRVAEPSLNTSDRNSTKKRPQATEAAAAIRLRYPDGKHDAETLLVHPVSGNIYIVTKVLLVNPVVYEAAAPFSATKVSTMRRIGEIRVPSLFGGVLTGGSISPNGRRVALCDYFQGYELALPAGATDFNDIWKQKMIGFDLGKRKQGEAITYRLDGKALLATSEGKQAPLIQVIRN
jgi:hypothetical protein